MIKKITLLISVLTAFGCSSANKKQDRDPASVSILAQGQSLTHPNNNKSLLEELTGKKSKVPYTEAQLKKMPLSTQHYYAGVRAAESKNYILAIKQYNTVIKRYPNSKDVKAALIAKSNLYKEMGLKEPASLNLRLAAQKSKPAVVIKAKSAKPLVANKAIVINKLVDVNKKSVKADTDILNR